MTKTRVPPTRVPMSKVPLIGNKKDEEGRVKAQETVRALMEVLSPTLDGIILSIEELQKRVAVLEEVKKIFPDNITVIIKNEKN